jgi:hypothetical protein
VACDVCYVTKDVALVQTFLVSREIWQGKLPLKLWSEAEQVR